MKFNSETIFIKFYGRYSNIHYTEEYYRIIESPYEHMVDFTIELFESYYSLKIIDFWYDGNKIYFNFDSGAKDILADRGEDLIIILIKTISSYPNVEEIELLIDGEKGCFGSQVTYSAFKTTGHSVDWDTTDVRFYFENGIDPFDFSSSVSFLDYETEQISYKGLLDDTVRYMLHYSGIKVIDIWYENTRLFVDLHEDEYYRLNNGTTAGIGTTQVLINTFSSYPGVEEIVFLIDGVRNCWADHFGFDVVFIANNES